MRHSPILLVALLACTGVDARSDAGREGDSAPTRPAAMAAELDTVQLARAFARAREMSRLHSVLVQWRGELVAERYFNGATAARRANIKSASKSVLSALIGIAIAQGELRGVNQPIGELLPSATGGLDSVKRAITVGDLLSMRAGLRSTSFNNYGRWVTSGNWVRFALQQPLEAEPGGPMIYSTGSSHILSAILTRVTGISTHQFAQRHLASPLGINLRPWQRDPQGIYFGGNDMYMTPRDMLKVGTLYLNGGVYEGKRIIPKEWIDSTYVTRGHSRFNGNEYGYGWWTRYAHGHAIRYAWGYGGQFIFIVPTLDLIVVVTSEADTERERNHTRNVHRLLEEEIVPSVLQ